MHVCACVRPARAAQWLGYLDVGSAASRVHAFARCFPLPRPSALSSTLQPTPSSCLCSSCTSRAEMGARCLLMRRLRSLFCTPRHPRRPLDSACAPRIRFPLPSFIFARRSGRYSSRSTALDAPLSLSAAARATRRIRRRRARHRHRQRAPEYVGRRHRRARRRAAVRRGRASNTAARRQRAGADRARQR